VSVHVVEHPLVHDALVTLRDAQTQPEVFRRMAVRISLLLAAEATRDLPASPVTVQTPLAAAEGRRVSADVVVVPVAARGARHARRDPGTDSRRARRPHRPAARREHGHRVAVLFEAARGLEKSVVLMIDPMLATGGSAVAALDHLTQAGRATSG
jgi:uracil phosphoribosyltransferase